MLRGDITALQVDAIVNAANPSLLGGGGVDGAIHDAAGSELLEACRLLKGCEVGEVKVTPGYRLPAKYVIHAVGPVWRGGHENEGEKLAACYRRAVEVAEEQGIESLAIPAISCGIYGFPIKAAADIAVRTVHAALEAAPQVQAVLLVAFDDDVEAALRGAYARLPRSCRITISKDATAITCLDDWAVAGAPKGGARQWKDGRSAKELARAWCGPAGVEIPREISALFASHPRFAEISSLRLEPEVRVRFDSLPGEPRNADLVGIAETPTGRVAISIEAKADESFDQTVAATTKSVKARIARGENSNSLERIRELLHGLLPMRADNSSDNGKLRYQLFTATAGALSHAVANGCSTAALVIHEFRAAAENANHKRNSADLNAFVRAVSGGTVAKLESGVLVGPLRVPGSGLFTPAPDLYVGKAVTILAETR